LGGAHLGDVYQYVGTTPLSSPHLKTQDYSDASKWAQVGTAGAAETKAYITGSSLVAAGTLTQTATAGETIDAEVEAASVALAGGGSGVSAAGAGAHVLNRIGSTVQTYIASSRGAGIKVGGDGTNAIALKAQDTATITATGGVASLAAAFGAFGGSAAVALSLARNDIASTVQAYLSSATVHTTSGLTQIEAIDAPTAMATSQAAPR